MTIQGTEVPPSPTYSAAVLDNTYSYDQNANVAAITDGTTGNGGNRSMLYDGLDRLTSTSAPNEWWISATNSYDGLDNLTSNTVGNRSYAYSYDPSSRRLSQLTRPDASIAYTLNYDAFGNVTSKGAGQDSYSFDAANRMQSVTGKESYQYDGYGRRVKITRLSDNLLDYPIYTMSGQLLSDEDQRSNKSTDYINLNGSLVAKRSAAIGTTTWTTNYEHTDALHSPNAETDSAGNITSAKRYTPYGEPGDSLYVQGPGFTGHVTDSATGLTYAQQRYYDPVLGRFLSVDPAETDGNSGARFNRYAYADDNPFRFIDPDGRRVENAPCDDCALVPDYSRPGDQMYVPSVVAAQSMNSSMSGGNISDKFDNGRFAQTMDNASSVGAAGEVGGAVTGLAPVAVGGAVVDVGAGALAFLASPSVPRFINLLSFGIVNVAKALNKATRMSKGALDAQKKGIEVLDTVGNAAHAAEPIQRKAQTGANSGAGPASPATPTTGHANGYSDPSTGTHIQGVITAVDD